MSQSEAVDILLVEDSNESCSYGHFVLAPAQAAWFPPSRQEGRQCSSRSADADPLPVAGCPTRRRERRQPSSRCCGVRSAMDRLARAM